MKLFSTIAAVAAVVVTAQDGGVRVESARAQPIPAPAATAASTPDAGTPAPRVEKTAVPAGKPPAPQAPAPAVTPPAADNSAELARVRSQLEAQTAKLDAAVRELEQVRAQLREKNERDQRQAATVETQRAAAVTLGNVDQQLATGNTNVTGQLAAVEGSLGPAARENLQRAREALANSDLQSARYFLSRAASDAQAGR